MKGMGNLVKSRVGELVFSLLSGCAYFIVLAGFIINNTQNGGLMLSMFFFPAIVCGAALILIKTIRKLKEEELFSKINILIYAHILLMIISVAFLIDMLISK